MANLKRSGVSLKESDIALLEALRRARGARSRSEVIRHLIREEAEERGIDAKKAQRELEAASP